MFNKISVTQIAIAMPTLQVSYFYPQFGGQNTPDGKSKPHY